MDNNKSGASASITFSAILGIVFIVLKLCKVIDWPWVWILCPFWIPIVIAIIFVAFFVWLFKR